MTFEHRHSGIVVGVDGSPASTTAVEWAAQDAEMRNVPLKLVHAIAPIVPPTDDGPAVAAVAEYEQLQDDQARQIIEQALKVAEEAVSPGWVPNVTSETLKAPMVPALVRLSTDAELLVVGSRGQGAVARALLGSVSSGVVHHAHCPVVVMHDEAAATARSPQAPVVVGIDGSPTSELATAIAFDEASRRGVELVALHAWSDMGPLGFPSIGWAPIEWRNIRDEEEEVLSERLSGWQARYPDVGVHKIVVCDQPAPRLLEQAQQAQLVVVGSHGRGGFPGMLLGSVSTAVVNTARIPVIIARVFPAG
ncbi:universal stress protein [Mycobacterium ahvazicum]|uniref:Universal stress protein n=1 Tax=Mycobacterium ahvazicum TaxID=1964395 RepID=A0A2K4Y6E3_9MYCO|nr:universal stress protein [Mycobacterium ahvazicum]SOX52354.1 universal stress protein [Mycobacterium ahvazicum]